MRTAAISAFAALLLCSGQSLSQWTQTAGPEGGRASAMLTMSTAVLLGLEGGALYRSTDHGTTWSPRATGVNTLGGNISGLASSGSVLLLSTTRNGVFRSTDDGMTWAASNGGLTTNGYYVEAVVTKGTAAILATQGGPFLSTDGGVSWVQANGGLPADTAFGALCATATMLFLGSDEGAGVFVSTDNGSTWTRASTGLGGDGARVGSFAASGGTVVAGTRQGAFRSTDNGAHWTISSSGLTTTAVSALYANGGSIFAGTYGAGAYRSTDGGVTWNPTGSIDNPNVRTFTAVGSDLLAGTYGGQGVYRSSNSGAAWVGSGKGVVATGVYAIAASGGRTIAATSDIVTATTDQGATWSRSDSGLNSHTLYALFPRTNDLFAGTTGSGAYRSTDGGISWSPANAGLNGNAATVWDMAYDGTYLYAATSSGIFRSSNSGGQWVQRTSGITDSLTMKLIAANGVVCCGTRSSVYRSTNAGESWTAATDGLPQYYQPTDFAAVGGYLFVSITGGVYRSADNGAHWILTGAGLPSYPDVQALLAYPRSAPNHPALFAGLNNGGVYVSQDTGLTWVDCGSGLAGPGVNVSCLVADQGMLFAGTPGGGVWRRPITQMVTALGRLAQGPAGFVLEQNYPNPFNPHTTITFGLPRSSLVHLSVFDILGRELSVLADGRRDAGVYSVEFDGVNLASGVYFYRLQAGEFTQAKRLLLLK